MGLESISMHQALLIWSELEQAYYGDAAYSSDTAEIYAYRLTPFNPIAHNSDTKHFPGRQRILAMLGLDAADAMVDLLEMFAKERGCDIRVDNEPLSSKMRTWIFDHRWHVRVVHRVDQNTTPSTNG